MKGKISLFLAVTLIFQGLFGLITPAFATTNSKDLYDTPRFFESDPLRGKTWEDYKLEYGISMETPRLNKEGFPFSIELWEDKRITVWGGPEDVPANDFKKETSNEGVVTKNTGYYKNGTGEYRYRGYDAAGNPYGNSNFPKDKTSNRTPSEKNWIYRVWNKDGEHYLGTKGNPLIERISDYNEAAINENEKYSQELSNSTKAWIDNGLPFQIVESTNSNKNPYNYAHIKTRPTSLFPGESTMWHVNNPGKSNASYYTQTFSISKIEDKAPTPVQAEIHIEKIKDEAIGDSGAVVVSGYILGKLMDDHMYDGVDEDGIPDDVLRGAYYNREDISSWTFTLEDQIVRVPQTLSGRKDSENTGVIEFELSIPYEKYKAYITVDNPNLEIVLNASAHVHYNTGEKATGYASTDGSATGNPPIEPDAPPTETVEIDVPIYIEPIQEFNFDISAPKKMLDTERFRVVDATETEVEMTKRVIVNGTELSESDSQAFLNGQHLFPLVGADKVYTYRVIYEDQANDRFYEYISYVTVFTTKPSAQFTLSGTHKENRLIEATQDDGGNSFYLLENATLTSDYFTVTNMTGAESFIKYGTKTDAKLAFIVKDQARLELKRKVTAHVTPSKIQRSDIPSGYFSSNEHRARLLVQEDHKPALVANIWNGVLSRGETLNFTYEPGSVDEDTIQMNTYKIYYDADGDETPETLIEEGNYEDYTDFTPTELGQYKIVFYAKESFGQPTLSEFITDADYHDATIERPFYVDNIAPMTKIYTDIPYSFPKVDVMVLNDESITRELNNTVLSERINWINALRQAGLEGWVEVWDLHTYVTSKDASTSRNTGGSYPRSSISYTSGGFSGTLYLYDEENNREERDDGGYESKPVSQTFTASHKNTVTTTGTYNPWSSQTSESSPAPSSKYINQNGFSGSIPRVGTSQDYDSGETKTGEDTWKWVQKFTAYYEGKLTKTEQVYVPDWNWYDNYTGYYSGTLYKYVKQSFVPTFRNGSDKYLVYFADTAVNNKADIQSVLNKGDARLILVSKPAAKSQLTHDYWIDVTKPFPDIVKQINGILSENNPVDNRKLLLVNQTFETNVANFDMEGDPLTEIGFQYIHEPTYFDNSMGQELGTNLVYTQTDFTPDMKDRFSKSGKYTIYRLIEDRPSGKPDFNKVSNTPVLDVYVHRKPIAKFALDWDYNPDVQTYKTTWVDLSYDKDHQHTDPERGIRDRQIMYRKTDGDNQWIYAIPDNLAPGNYEVRYIVKDIEGVWSDPFVERIVLEDVPELELKGKLTPKTLPASEKVTLYDIETKYHLPHGLKIDLMGAGGVWIKEVCDYGETDYSHRIVDGSKHNWNAIATTLSEGLSDGAYYMRLISGRVALDLPFTIQTPISVQGQVSELIAGETGVVRAVAGQYAKTVYAKVFEGTPYEQHVQLAQIGTQPSGESIWEADFEVGDGVVEDQYRFKFYAQTASGNEASHLVMKQVIVLKILSFDVTGYWNHWRGQGDLDGKTLTLNPHRFLGLEKVRFTAFVQGNPDEIKLDLSEGLKAMTYRDGFGNLYKYTDEFEADIAFPVFLVENEPGVWLYEYNLPVTAPTLSWDDVRIGPSYTAEIKVTKGAVERHKKIEDIDLTGTIFDLIYTQPYYGTH